MHRRLLVLFCVVLATLDVVVGRVCTEVAARNNVAYLRRVLGNCSIVTGTLQIALMEKSTEEDFDSVSFPELTEVWGTVLVYKVHGLRNLGALLPNLRVIRGYSLFEDYSLVVHNVSNLETIGLTKLKRIERGFVYISKCPNLCYAESVNWTKLGTKLSYYNKVLRPCIECQQQCHGHCWNEEDCQDMTNLVRCPHYENGLECVDKCPKNMYVLVPGNKCIARDECLTLRNGHRSIKWFILNDTCTNSCPAKHKLITDDFDNTQCVWCGEDCIVECVPKSAVDSLSTLGSFRDCQYVKGSLILRIDKDELLDELQMYLGNITEIRDYLKIHRSPALKNLKFFKKLRKIGGENLSGGNAVIVLDNHNMASLWDWSDFSLEIEKGGLSFHYNHRLCLSTIKRFAELTHRENYTDLDVSPRSNGDQGVCEPFKHEIRVVEYNSTNVTLQWDVINSTADGYFVYYKKTDVVTNESCGDDWVVVVGAANTRVLINNLSPYTNYTFYLMMNSNSSHPYSRTKQHYFMTLPDDPGAPDGVKTVSYSWDTMTLYWDPPEEPRGKLNRYVITQRAEPDTDRFIWQRDYCKRPSRENRQHEVTPFFRLSKDNCECNRSEPDNALTIQLEGLMSAQCEKITSRDEPSKRKRCQAYNDYTKFDKKFGSDHARHKRMDVNYDVESYAGPEDTNFTITDLKPFTIYVFLISACNENITQRQLCSEVVMVNNRTLPKDDADDILHWDIRVDDKGITVDWSEPASPNSVIVAYEIEHRQLDIENVKPIDVCLTKLQASGGVHTLHLHPGSYQFRLRAVSLAGPGRYTSVKTIVVAGKAGHSLLIGSLTFCILVTISCIAFYVFYRWKKKHEHEKLHLITSVNPDYAGPMYTEDEWELERSNVDILKDLGQGTFGMVYSGFIRSMRLPCAIKTVNDNANFEDRVEFLNEASVMKTFSDAHHVVRLLGVVSRGQPPLVVMELMACGDLKTFLRKSRDSSQSITCNEMYRMAAEIADGMAYLAAKKFIHRDLAARNCMVSADHTIKIGDFGMARDIYETDYYRKETKGLLPVRWMAPESLADGVFTTDSDVWSYGVVLWEMVTLAEQPYQGLANEQVFQFVIAHGTLDRPSECPDLLYDIMQVCWKWRPNNRPLFTDIVKNFDGHVGQDFQLVSFYHSREGEEYRINAKERPVNHPAMSAAPDGEIFARYNVSDDDISLYNADRDTSFLSFPPQRHSRLSDYSLNTSPKNGLSSYPLTPQ